MSVPPLDTPRRTEFVVEQMRYRIEQLGLGLEDVHIEDFLGVADRFQRRVATSAQDVVKAGVGRAKVGHSRCDCSVGHGAVTKGTTNLISLIHARPSHTRDAGARYDEDAAARPQEANSVIKCADTGEGRAGQHPRVHPKVGEDVRSSRLRQLRSRHAEKFEDVGACQACRKIFSDEGEHRVVGHG